MQSSLWDWTAPDVHVNWVTLSDWKSSRVVPKFRKKAFAVGFVRKLTTGSVFRWWHQSFKEGQRVKKQQGRRMEQVTRLKLERWRDDGVKERGTDVWQMRSYRQERWKSKSWKPAKQKAWWLYAFSTYWPIYTTVQQPMRTQFGIIRGTVLHVKRIVHKQWKFFHRSFILASFKIHLTFLLPWRKIHNIKCLYNKMLFTIRKVVIWSILWCFIHCMKKE